jgi:RimJ/RimL family protein N-acetyltransferase
MPDERLPAPQLDPRVDRGARGQPFRRTAASAAGPLPRRLTDWQAGVTAGALQGASAPMNTLRAGDLRLEPQTAAHACAMFEVLADPAIYAFENAPPRSVAWLEERFRRLETRRSPDGSEAWLNWVVRLPGGELAGYVQATVRPDASALIAYEFASRHWGRGIGSAATRAVLHELQATWGVRVGIAVCKRANLRSAAMLQRLGFRDDPPPGVAPHACDHDERVVYRLLAVDTPAG